MLMMMAFVTDDKDDDDDEFDRILDNGNLHNDKYSYEY